MRRIVAITAVAAVLGGSVIIWRRNPRIGTRFVNSVVNPMLLGRGLAGGRRSELGTLEHVGRKSRIRRRTPVHPEPTSDGFRIIVPLGTRSEWARNVLAAGHCRLELHESDYELDEPRMAPAAEIDDLPWVIRSLMGALGFRYLMLRTFASRPHPQDGSDPSVIAPQRPTSGESSQTEDDRLVGARRSEG
jgi:hypothetical protein